MYMQSTTLCTIMNQQTNCKKCRQLFTPEYPGKSLCLRCSYLPSHHSIKLIDETDGPCDTEAIQITCAKPECGRLFIPVYPGNKFCSRCNYLTHLRPRTRKIITSKPKKVNRAKALKKHKKN